MRITNQTLKKMNTTKNKKMLNTKDMTAGSGKIRPVLDPGNHKIKINNITFDQTPYDTEAYNIVLHVEGEALEGEFEGFLVDPTDAKGPRYKGQVGRVRFSPWPYKDAQLPSGREISRDTEVLKSMIYLAEVLECREELDAIESENIEDFMNSCNSLFTGESCSVFVNACIAGREWENKEGYINSDLFLPRISRNGISLEKLDVEDSKLIEFNKDNHITPIKKKKDVDSFEPKSENDGSDFEL